MNHNIYRYLLTMDSFKIYQAITQKISNFILIYDVQQYKQNLI